MWGFSFVLSSWFRQRFNGIRRFNRCERKDECLAEARCRCRGVFHRLGTDAVGNDLPHRMEHHARPSREMAAAYLRSEHCYPRTVVDNLRPCWVGHLQFGLGHFHMVRDRPHTTTY